jgi:hypothetical protein
MVNAAEYLHPTVTRLVGEGRAERALEVLGDGAYAARSQGMDEEFVSCLVDRAQLLSYRGDTVGALAALDEADATIRTIAEPETVLIALRMRAALTSPSWRTVDRLVGELGRAATSGDDVAFAAWAVSEEATSLALAGDPAGAAALFATLTQVDYPSEVSGVALAPEAGLAAALRRLGCLEAAAAVLMEAQERYGEDDRAGGVRDCLVLAERFQLLSQFGRREAADDVRKELQARARVSLGRVETRILELSRGTSSRPTTFLVAAMRQWETIAGALGDRTAIVRCWLVSDVALARLDPAGDPAAQVAALKFAAEVAVPEGFDRLYRRIYALQAMVTGGQSDERGT